jgi:hypothetical protein
MHGTMNLKYIYTVRRETGCEAVCSDSVAHYTFLFHFPVMCYLPTLSVGVSNRFMNLNNLWNDADRGKLKYSEKNLSK